MFLYKGKEYYPLEVAEIKSKNKKVIYDRTTRNKSYVYIALKTNEDEGEE